MHMIRKGRFIIKGGDGKSFADQFYMLAGQVRPAQGKYLMASAALTLAC
jgi:hypothetical protein